MWSCSGLSIVLKKFFKDMSTTCAIWWPCAPAAQRFWNVCHQDNKNKAIRFLFPTEAKMQIHYLAAFLTFKDTDITINNVSQGSRRVWAKRVWGLKKYKKICLSHPSGIILCQSYYVYNNKKFSYYSRPLKRST